MIKLLIGAVILFVVIAVYVLVSYLHDKSGLSGGCTGNCGSCRMNTGCDKEKK